MPFNFSQVFYDDYVVDSVLQSLRSATKHWTSSSLSTEAVLLNDVSGALLQVASKNCKSKIYPDCEVSAFRTILDRKGAENRDLFGADLAVTLSLEEQGVITRQRTALFQLKVGSRRGSEVSFALDVRQIYTVGHNKHSLGRWFIAVCDHAHGLWSFGSDRQVGGALNDDQTSKAAFPNSADRTISVLVTEEWRSISAWVLDWLAGAIGVDSDLTDERRLEAVLTELRSRESAKSAKQNLGPDFERQFAEYGLLMPRVHIEYLVKESISKRG